MIDRNQNSFNTNTNDVYNNCTMYNDHLNTINIQEKY